MVKNENAKCDKIRSLLTRKPMTFRWPRNGQKRKIAMRSRTKSRFSIFVLFLNIKSFIVSICYSLHSIRVQIQKKKKTKLMSNKTYWFYACQFYILRSKFEHCFILNVFCILNFIITFSVPTSNRI